MTQFKKQRMLKLLAFYLLINIFISIVCPSLCSVYASVNNIQQTHTQGGDDLVNLKTGDFNYNVPLLEVPGPNGSIPLNLSYKSGIGAEQSASWVGLGWELNPGAISRMPVGVPDDYNNANVVVTDTWTGTTTESYHYWTTLGAFMTPECRAWANAGGWGLQKLEASFSRGYLPGTSTTGTSYYGSLNGKDATTPTTNITTNRSMDFQNLHDIRLNNYYAWYLLGGLDPEKMLGGTLPAYDKYFVSGPGIKGMMEPVILDNGSLFGVKTASVDYNIIRKYTQPKQQFRFKEDYSNSLIVNPDNPDAPTDTIPSYTSGGTSLGYSYKGPEERGFDASTMTLAGSKHIQYFSNLEITNNTAKGKGFINYPGTVSRGTLSFTTNEATPQTFSSDVSAQVGGFSITNEDGMTYHYALPAYTYGFKSNLSAPDKTWGMTNRLVKEDQPVAYTWLLTSITGADFVDKNNNGIADEEDTGLWKNFNYGKWKSDYINRYPYTGTSKTNDGAVQYNSSYSEVYYLDAAYTKSHTAIFLKQDRIDGYGANSRETGGIIGGYASRLLKLRSINLYTNTDLIDMSSISTNSFTKSIYSAIEELKKISTQKLGRTNYSGIIDFDDIYTGPGTVSTYFSKHNVLNRINLTQDYSLSPGILDNENLLYGLPASGKLTLNSVGYYGLNEMRLKPSVDFNYDLTNPGSVSNAVLENVPSLNGYSSKEGRIRFPSTFPFVEGDIIKFTSGGKDYYATLLKQIGSSPTYFYLHFLGSNMPTSAMKGSTITVTQTKNPPFTADHYDNWKYFKSDYKVVSPDPANYINSPSGIDNFDHRTSTISSKSVDVWSLRTITTSTGATITMNYESDSHSNILDNNGESKIQPKSVLNVDKIGYTKTDLTTTFDSPTNDVDCSTVASNELVQFTFKEQLDLAEEFYENQVIRVQRVYTYETQHMSYTSYSNFKVTFIGSNSSGTKCIRGYFPNGFGCAGASTMKNNGCYLIYEPKQKFGGGVRVKNITVQESANGDYFKTDYTYTNKATGYSSGVTSDEPLGFNGIAEPNEAIGTDYSPIDPLHPENNCYTCNRFPNMVEAYHAFSLYNSYRNLFAFGYFNPEVIYEYVTSKQSGNGANQATYVESRFKVFSDDMLQKSYDYSSYVLDMEANPAAYHDGGASVTKLTYNTSCIGNLMYRKIFDQNNQLISEENYTYSGPTNNQGVVEQVFHQYRTFTPSNGKLNIVTVKSEIPTVLSSVTTKDHIKGISSTVSFSGHDYYTGQPLQVSSKDSYGNTVQKSYQPAYHLYTSLPSAGSEIGLRVKNINNKHLLGLNAAMYSTNPNNTGSFTFTLSSLTSTTGASTTRYKAVLDNNKKLPFSCTPNLQQSVLLNIGGTLTAATVRISYIYPDRKSFEFYHDNASLGSTGSVTNLNVSSPLSATIQPWSNNWQYRNYNATSSQFENLTITESSPATPNAYKKIWRPAAAYVWNSPFLNSDGSYKSTGTGAYVEFDWSAELAGNPQSGMTASAYWQKGTQSTLKDEYSNTLEVKDVNGNYAATKMAIDQSFVLNNIGGYTYTYPNTANYNNYVLSSGKNTNYVSFAFSSFEELSKPSGASSNQYGGEITGYVSGSQYSATTTPLVKPHTGNYSLKLYPGVGSTPFTASYKAANTEGNIIREKKYRASVWVHKSSNANASMTYSVIGNSGSYSPTASIFKSSSTITVGDWSLLTLDFDVPSTYSSITSTDLITVSLSAGTGNNSYFDDFAVRPIDADQTSYVYDPLTKQVLYVIDKDGFYTRYQYDNTGRVIATYKETLAGEKKIATQEYNFAKP